VVDQGVVVVEQGKGRDGGGGDAGKRVER